MKPFIPQLVYFEREALDYLLGRELDEDATRLHDTIQSYIAQFFPEATIEYFT